MTKRIMLILAIIGLMMTSGLSTLLAQDGSDPASGDNANRIYLPTVIQGHNAQRTQEDVNAPALAASAQPQIDRASGRELPAGIADLKLDAPVELSGLSSASLDSSLLFAQGESKVIIRLVQPSVAEQGVSDAAAVRARNDLRQQQAAFLSRVQALDPNARTIAQTQIVLNAVFVEVDAAVLPQLAQDPAVLRIAPAGIYEMDLSETVPYIGAAAVQAAGYTGRGVRVAVLDSGIDYTH
ncbi:MAG: hypothetical protein R6W76_00950, partial [Caldilinea sp.]